MLAWREIAEAVRVVGSLPLLFVIAAAYRLWRKVVPGTPDKRRAEIWLVTLCLFLAVQIIAIWWRP